MATIHDLKAFHAINFAISQGNPAELFALPQESCDCARKWSRARKNSFVRSIIDKVNSGLICSAILGILGPGIIDSVAERRDLFEKCPFASDFAFMIDLARTLSADIPEGESPDYPSESDGDVARPLAISLADTADLIALARS